MGGFWDSKLGLGILGGAAVLVVGGVIAVALTPEDDASSSATAQTSVATQTTEPVATTEPVGGGNCQAFAENVENYNTLEPGSSRGEYLTLLHRFQRDCPDEALQAGLTGEGLPQCEFLDQENCTMWQG